jgi:hypothetical protein
LLLEGWSLDERGVVIVVASGRSLIGRYVVGEDRRNGDTDERCSRESGVVIVFGAGGRR